MHYSVREAIGPYGITLADGDVVYRAIYPVLRAGQPVEVDFSGVQVYAAPFLNAAFGALLRDLSRDDLRRLLKICSLSQAGMNTLQRVIEDAQQYYHDPAAREAIDAILDEQAEAV